MKQTWTRFLIPKMTYKDVHQISIQDLKEMSAADMKAIVKRFPKFYDIINDMIARSRCLPILPKPSEEFKRGFEAGLKSAQASFELHISEWPSDDDCRNQCEYGRILKRLAKKLRKIGAKE